MSMKRLIRKIGVSIIRMPKRNALKASAKCTGLVRGGQVGQAIELMEASPKLHRYESLMAQVVDGRLKNRAPEFKDQLEFFQRARALVDLKCTDEIKYQVALGYNALESLDHEAISMVKCRINEILPVSRVLTARRNFPYISKKRGHHFFYSLSMVLAHIYIHEGACESLSKVVCETESMFLGETLPNMDQGFGYGGTNAVKILGIGATMAALQGDQEEQRRLVKIMLRMMELIFTRKVGPIDFNQFYRGCAQVFAVGKLPGADSNAAGQVMMELLRLKNPVSKKECVHRFLNMFPQSQLKEV